MAEDGTTIMGDNLESKTRQDVYRKHLERQRSREFDRSVTYYSQHCMLSYSVIDQSFLGWPDYTHN